ncbi:MAG: hypothetical protein N3C12_07235 [Candidatus Binatia bacterium]|nr:hypothetical protein [Candidatus Binatia bacterium]
MRAPHTVCHIAIVGIAWTLALTGWAQSVVRVGEEEGALYDGILDGYPGVALFDGTPDLAGNPPSAALKFGVLEMRTVVEFPLTALHGYTLQRATLAFNIDDVITTFGPGADFSGRAASRILVHTYCADGQIELADFARTARDPWSVDTTSYGTITDALLARLGPIRFSLDVTAAITELANAGCAWAGFVFRTLDNNTATSLDDLGDGGSYGGTKGANGAVLPYLELALALTMPTPTPTATVTAAAAPTFTSTPTVALPPPSMPPTASPPPSSDCAGDCDRDGLVSIYEILTLVRIALDLDLLATCPAGDADHDQTITVADIVAAVERALAGCPQPLTFNP